MAHLLRNPDYLPSVDEVERLGAVAGGVYLTQGINNSLALPLFGRFLPFGAKINDVLTTWGSAIAVGWLGRMIVGRFADDAELGGKGLAVAKGINVVIPTWTIKVQGPSFGRLADGLGAPALPPAPAAPAAPQPAYNTKPASL